MKKILVITTSFPYKGGEYEGIFVMKLCRQLSKHFNVTVLAPHLTGQQKSEVVEGIKIYRFQYAWPETLQRVCYGAGILTNLKHSPLQWLLLPGFFLSAVITSLLIVRKEKIDLIHAHWLFPAGLAAVTTSRLTRIPMILTTHGPDVIVAQHFGLRGLARVVAAGAVRVTAVSQSMARVLVQSIKARKDQVVVIPMGVDTRQFCLPQDFKEKSLSEPLLLFVGWLNENKGGSYLLQAFSKIAKQYPNSRLRMVGTGPLLGEMKHYVAKQGLSRQVEFLGGVSNSEMPRIYRESSIFVLPSKREGVPVSILEALACGCPVIATPVGGVGDILEHKKTGILINPGSVRQIIEAVQMIIDDASFYNKLSKNGRALAETYDWQIIAEKFREVFNYTGSNQS